MTGAIRTLLSGLIDYAGMFPPAALSMEEASRNYEAYRAGPHSWALGRFIVPSARLNEVDPDWEYVILGVPPRRVPVCELKVASAAEAAPMLDALPEGVTAYFELPIDADPAPLAKGRGRAKVRTGGLTPDAFPAPADLARFLYRCAKARVPFKATAGLHHPIRSVQRCTYEARRPHRADARIRQRLPGCLAALARGERGRRDCNPGRGIARVSSTSTTRPRNGTRTA